MNPGSFTSNTDWRVSVWLLICCLMIYAMVVLGGVTRLTGSGLSMVEWDPVFGILPPLNDREWQAVFSKYQDSPEYRHVNMGMNLAGFKSIYWFEYAHRLLGRAIGTVFLLPFLYFWIRKKLPRKHVPRLAAAFLLGGAQGLLGWYMVKSGLVNDPHVSQYRLTAHLGLALFIYAWLWWLLLDLIDPCEPGSVESPLVRRLAWGTTGLISLTVLSGGFVAGLKAGLAFNTFPKMADGWLPPGGWSLSPGWRNLFENMATVQFDHRLLAMITLLSVMLLWILQRSRVSRDGSRMAMHLLLTAVLLQVSLGITTLLLYVPVPLAALHQAGAVLLLTAALYLNHKLRS